MIEWALILMPLLVLPIVILFRFVGCAQEPTPEEVVVEQLPPDEPPSHPPPSPPVDTKPPNYQKYILGEPNNPGQVKNNQVQPNGSDVIAYWRLVDASTTNVAEDLKKFQNGVYMQGHVLPAIDPTPTAGGSEKRDPAHFIPGEKSLIDSDPKTTLCRGFEGGYVFVEYEPGLYTEEFTIEAWIKADALAQNLEHTLFDAGEFYGSPAGTPAVNRGFRIFANRDKSWQMRLGQSTVDVFPNPPVVPLGARTHLTITVANKVPGGGPQKNFTLYVDGKVVLPVIERAYAPPHDAPYSSALRTRRLCRRPCPRRPEFLCALRWLCRVQEVVLHRKALSKEEIEKTAMKWRAKSGTARESSQTLWT